MRLEENSSGEFLERESPEFARKRLDYDESEDEETDESDIEIIEVDDDDDGDERRGTIVLEKNVVSNKSEDETDEEEASS